MVGLILTAWLGVPAMLTSGAPWSVPAKLTAGFGTESDI